MELNIILELQKIKKETILEKKIVSFQENIFTIRTKKLVGVKSFDYTPDQNDKYSYDEYFTPLNKIEDISSYRQHELFYKIEESTMGLLKFAIFFLFKKKKTTIEAIADECDKFIEKTNSTPRCEMTPEEEKNYIKTKFFNLFWNKNVRFFDEGGSMWINKELAISIKDIVYSELYEE